MRNNRKKPETMRRERSANPGPVNDMLDEALEDTFPASDPVAVGSGGRASPRPAAPGMPAGGWRMHRTLNDLPEAARTQSIALLNEMLADALDLRLQIKQAHWNVKGPSFIGLHELFDHVDHEVSEFTDEIAERVAQLGGVALGTLGVIAARSRLPEYPLEISDGRHHVRALSRTLAEFGRHARAAIDTATGFKDEGTADLFIEVSRTNDKLLWKVEAHDQDED